MSEERKVTLMATEKKAKEYYFHDIDNPYEDRGNTGWITSNIDLGLRNEPYTDETGKTFDGQLFTVYVPVPMGESVEEIEADAQELWGSDATMHELMCVVARQLSTRPNFKVDNDATDPAERHAEAQDRMFNYQIGRKATGGVTQKVKAQKLDALETQVAGLGMTMEELIADALRRKEAGEL
jgi:hypothetical protein